jgi:peptidoglycan/LPS O-acetylase OafA/YrhL
MNDSTACIDALASPGCGNPWEGWTAGRADVASALLRLLELPRADGLQAGRMALGAMGPAALPGNTTVLPLGWSMAMLLCIVAAILASMKVFSRRFPALSSEAPPHTRWLEGLRGFAVMLIVLNHVPLVVHNLQLSPTGFALGAETLVFLDYLGRLGVQIFFCITGCLFATKLLPGQDVDWTLFFVRRIRRLMPAYAAAVLAAIAVAGFFSRGVDRQFLHSAFQAVPSMMAFGFHPLPKIGAFDTARLLGMNWTLAFEWRFYLALPLIFAVTRAGRAPVGVAVALVALALLIVEGVGVWVFLALGALASPLAGMQTGASHRAAARLILGVVATSMLLNWAVIDQSRVLQGLHVLTLFCGIVIARPRVLACRSFVALGMVSYSFYLLHVMVLFAFFGICHMYLFDVAALEPLPFTLLACLGVTMVTALSALSYLGLERRFSDIHLAPEPRPVR